MFGGCLQCDICGCGLWWLWTRGGRHTGVFYEPNLEMKHFLLLKMFTFNISFNLVTMLMF